MSINFPIGGFFIAGMPLSDPTPQPELPEFALGRPLTTRERFLNGLAADYKRQGLRNAHRQPRLIGPMAPNKPLVHGEPVTGLSKAEKSWRQMTPLMAGPKTDHVKPPKGTAPTLEGLQRYLGRMADYEAEWRAIAATQDLELPTVAQELAQTGVSSFSLKQDDDEDDAIGLEVADDAERAACRYGTAYTTMDLAPIVRRIEWERYIYGCSPVQRVYITTREDGTMGVGTDSHALTKEELLPLARKLKQTLDGKTAVDLENNRTYAVHYGVVGSAMYGIRHGEPVPEQSFDLLGSEEFEVVTRTGGPQELGLHTVVDGMASYEPTANELWPEDYPELAFALYADSDDTPWLPQLGTED